MLKSLRISDKVTLTPENRVAIIPYTTEDNYLIDARNIIEKLISNSEISKNQLLLTGSSIKTQAHELSKEYNIQLIIPSELALDGLEPNGTGSMQYVIHLFR